MAAETAIARMRVPAWVGWVVPPAVIAILIALFVALDPIGSLREAPPVEALAIERTILEPGTVEVRVRNDGPDPVTIAQVLVDDTYWNFATTDETLGRLESAEITLDYPWDEGFPLALTFITSTGATVEHEIEVAVVTPGVDAETIAVYALLGVYIGVVPVAVGLLWLPSLRRASRKWITFVLAFTAGLLVFLLVDTTAEGLELAAATAAALDGVGIFAAGALMAVAALAAIGGLPNERSSGSSGMRIALLIAAGIGLHNLGEGLAVGAALAAGELAVGSALVVGFALHNTTEGLAIVAPFGPAGERPGFRRLALLGAIAGVPTIAGAWLGGFAFSPAWGALAFGLAAGAIAQVLWTIATGLLRRGEAASPAGAFGLAAGLLVMYATGLLVA